MSKQIKIEDLRGSTIGTKAIQIILDVMPTPHTNLYKEIWKCKSKKTRVSYNNNKRENKYF